MMAKNEQLLTVEEAAQWINVHPQTIRRWIIKGELKAMRLGQGRTARFRIAEEDFKNFLKRLVFSLSAVNAETSVNNGKTKEDSRHD